MSEGLEIAPEHTVREWNALQLNEQGHSDWSKAVDIFKSRIQRRFIDPVDVLIAHEIGHPRGTFGFAILALDCLLIETLQGFREGVINHNGRSQDLITRFLTERSHMKPFFADQDKARDFYQRCRSALLHSGQTDGDFRVERRGPLLSRHDDGRIEVNRSAFHEAVKHEFREHIDELRRIENGELRKNLGRVMNAICGIQ